MEHYNLAVLEYASGYDLQGAIQAYEREQSVALPSVVRNRMKWLEEVFAQAGPILVSTSPLSPQTASLFDDSDHDELVCGALTDAGFAVAEGVVTYGLSKVPYVGILVVLVPALGTAGSETAKSINCTGGRADRTSGSKDGLPTVGITGNGGVTEGDETIFSISMSPAPSSPVTVRVSVESSGEFGVTTGSHQVVIPKTGTGLLTLVTVQDTADEPDGSVTVTVDDSTSYAVLQTSGSATVIVSDNDDLPLVEPSVGVIAGGGVTEGGKATFTLSANPTPASPLAVTVTVAQQGKFGVVVGSRTVTLPTIGTYTLTVPTTEDEADEPDGLVTVTIDADSGYTVSQTRGLATVVVSDDDDPPPPVIPTVSIRASGGVAEGGGAVFTVTASPPPSTVLPVRVTVSQRGEFGAATGSQSIEVSTGGSYTLTVATVDDSTDEPNGSVTVAVDGGTGYAASSAMPSATVNVYDDDEASSGTQPTVNVSDASADEGAQSLTFVVTLSKAHTQPITFGYGAFSRSATSGSDFTIPYKTFTLQAGHTELDIVVPVVDDLDTEPDETLNLFVYATSGITIPGYFVYATGTITDND